MISVEGLTKVYGTFKAVDDISFEVKTGEILGFLGPNGAGKTTTMKVITGYMYPTSGDVKVFGDSVVESSIKTRTRIGYLPETAPLYMDMNVIDYLMYAAELRQVESGQRKERVREMVRVCGLKDVVRKNIGQLSKGFKQRVGLAQAMVHDPEILILDEPTVGLDPNQIVEIRNLIKEIGQQKTVILSTHILPEVQATCDRAIIINRGKIAADESLESLQSSMKGRERINLIAKGDKSSIESDIRNLNEIKNFAISTNPAGNFEVNFEVIKGVDIREKIFDTAVEGNWKMLELQREKISLEDVFRELTQENGGN